MRQEDIELLSFQDVVVSPLTPPRAERGASLFPSSANSSKSVSPVPPPSDEEMIILEANKLDAELNKVIKGFKEHARSWFGELECMRNEDDVDMFVNLAADEFVSKKIYKETERSIEIANIKPSREAVENAQVALRDLKIDTRVLLKFFPDISDYYGPKISAIRNGARFGFCKVNHVADVAATTTAAVSVVSSTPCA